MKDKIKFTGRCYDSGTFSLFQDKPPWAALSLLYAEWIANVAEVCANDQPVIYLENSPILANRYKVRIDLPIELGSSDPLWLFYQPAMSGYNGFSEAPHEIVQIKMIKCAINKLIHQTYTHAILAVTPEEIIDIYEVEERLPSTRESLNPIATGRMGFS